MSMIYPPEAFYVISGFSHRSDQGIFNSAFNFSIGLEPDFALKAYNKELPKGTCDGFDKIGKEMLKDLGFDGLMRNPYRFLENDKGNFTSLLRWCSVPGDACELGIDGMEVDYVHRNKKFPEGMLQYGPHNIDNIHQAYALLSIWLRWADYAYAITRKKE